MMNRLTLKFSVLIKMYYRMNTSGIGKTYEYKLNHMNTEISVIGRASSPSTLRSGPS